MRDLKEELLSGRIERLSIQVALLTAENVKLKTANEDAAHSLSRKNNELKNENTRLVAELDSLRRSLADVKKERDEARKLLDAATKPAENTK